MARKAKKAQKDDIADQKNTEVAGDRTNETENNATTSSTDESQAKEVESGENVGSVPVEESMEDKYRELHEKYLRLSAEFDNYRKRTLKEKMDLSKTAGESIFLNILPVVDDFERAMASIDSAKEIGAIKEGIGLIYNKFKEFMKKHGIKEIEAIETDFNTDLHEALTKIPAPDKKLKGKVVDVVEKGYFLNEKVLRFSKVVIGE